MRLLAALLLLFLAFALPHLALGDSGNEAEYIRVEVKGTLSAGVMAIGAETTGTTIRANNVTWELDFGDRKDLRELASKLDKQKVVVTGNYQRVRGVEIRERHLVKVTTLKAAD